MLRVVSKTLIIIPSFNERENIASLVEQILLEREDLDILVVDDSSPDGTAGIIEELQKKHPSRLNLIVRAGKGGRGSAVLRGFQFALERGYDQVFEMDADFSHKPSELHLFFAKMPEHDVVVGSRYLPQSEIHHWGWRRTIFSRFANMYARFILGIAISDYTNGYRLYTRKALEALDIDSIEAKGYVVLSEIAYQLHKKGMKFGEVPTIFVNRRRGASNLSFGEIREAFLSVLRIRSPRLTLHLEQVIRFAFCGGTAMLIDMGTLYFQVEHLHIDQFLAVYPSAVLSLTFVFLSNKFFTFRGHEGSWFRQIAKFLMVYGVGAGFNITIYTLLTVLGVYYLVSKLIAIAIVAFWNYALLHWFVFHKRE